jgi:hypothetical protein
VIIAVQDSDFAPLESDEFSIKQRMAPLKEVAITLP